MSSESNVEYPIVSLSRADGEALDAALAARARGARLSGDEAAPPTVQPQRAQRVAKLLALLDQWPADDPSDDLMQRTLATVADLRQRRRFAQQAHALTAPAIAFRWSELIAVAAVLMIGLSVLWPVLEKTRADARRIACANNLSAAGAAIGQYAVDYGGVLPRGRSQTGAAWWYTGKAPQPGGPVESNSYHLYLLARGQYVDPDTLACPANANAPRNMTAAMHDWPNSESASYSYQNQYAPQPIRLSRAPHLPVLADKTPLFAGPIYNRDLLPTSPSNLHQQIGQNILTADGNVAWSYDPMVRDDNIWLAQGMDPYTIKGTEIPTSIWDAFLVP